MQEEITNGIYDEKANKELEIYNNMGYKEEQATNLLCKKLDN